MNIALRREKVLELKNKVYTNVGIASILKTTPATVSNDIQFWKKQNANKNKACFKGSTCVKTLSGVKQMWDLNPGDKVLSVKVEKQEDSSLKELLQLVKDIKILLSKLEAALLN